MTFLVYEKKLMEADIATQAVGLTSMRFQF